MKTNTPKWQRLTEAQIADALEKSAGIMSVAAERLGVDRSTICRRAQKSQRLRNVIDAATERTMDVAEAALLRAIQKGEAWAVCFFLKCKAKQRGYSERTEITGPAGKPVQVAVSETELDKIIAGE
jgi:hypothetical protein